MISLIYVSSAVTPFTNEELVELLRLSRENNERLNITGLLLYNDGNFMQVLEGPEETVSQLYEKIKQDPRHKGVTTLVKEPISERQFGRWAMGFRQIDEIAREEVGISDFLTTPLTAEAFATKPSRALVLLQTFRDLIR